METRDSFSVDLLAGSWILAALRLPNGSITLGLAQIWMLLKRLLKVHSAVSQISIVSEFVLYPSNFDKILYSFINFERLYILVFCYFSPTLRLTTRNDRKAYFLHTYLHQWWTFKQWAFLHPVFLWYLTQDSVLVLNAPWINWMVVLPFIYEFGCPALNGFVVYFLF